MQTFERKETKYLLTPSQYAQFKVLVAEHLAPAEYPEGDVASVYYDTPDDVLVNRSLAAPKYKEKLRMRSYGTASAGSPVFVEIKKKFKGITYKRRVSCTLQAAQAFLAGMPYEEAVERWPLADAEAQAACHMFKSRQVAGEIAWMRDHYEGLAPKMLVSTHRESFVAADDPELRITFDEDVRWSDDAPTLERPAGEHGLFANGERILEVKCAGSIPLWLVDALSQCGIRPQSVSKYGRAYLAAHGAAANGAANGSANAAADGAAGEHAAGFATGAATQQAPASGPAGKHARVAAQRTGAPAAQARPARHARIEGTRAA